MTNHSFGRFVGFLTSALILAVIPFIGPAHGDWPRFLNRGFDGASGGTAAIDWTVPPQFRWSLEVGDGYGMGAVVGDRYYAFDSRIASSGERTERLRAIDLQSGKAVWSVERPLVYRDLYGYEPGPRTTPTVHEDKIVTMGVAGELCCRDRADGTLRWRVDTKEKYGVVQNFFGVGASPLILDDQVVVMVGGSPESDQALPLGRIDRASPDGSLLVAFDIETGEPRWQAGDDLASYSSPRPIELEGQTYVLAFGREGLTMIDPRDGTVVWSFSHRADMIESVNAMTPVVWRDLVFISECYQVGSMLLKVSPDGYAAVWRDPPRNRRAQSMRSHWSTPNLVGGYLYGCSGRNATDSDFRCLDFRTGEVQWVDDRRTRSSATQVGRVLLVLEERGGLQVIGADPTELDVISDWDLGQAEGQRPQLRGPCWAAPLVVGNQLLVRGDEKVLCLELAER